MADHGEGSLLGTRIGHIHVSALLGSGGMGEVYSGFDEKLRRKVAIKALRADRGWSATVRERLLREARVLSELDHPNICRIYDIVSKDDRELLVLEFVQGSTLRQVIARGLAPKDRLPIAEQVAGALVAAHARGIVHRDLKPENVMLLANGQIKVLDFGLARHVWEEMPTPALGSVASDAEPSQFNTPLTTAGDPLGTPGYASPEQVRGEPVTAASDIYAFGLLLQELLTGKRPFSPQSDRRLLLEQSMRGETLPIEGVRWGLRRLIRQLKSLDPSDRPTAREARDRLRRIRETPRRRLRQLAAVGALLATFTLGSLFLGGSSKELALSDPVQVTTAIGVEDYMTWSPDETTLAYDASEAGTYSNDWDVWVAPLDGGPAVNRTADNPGMDRYPSWSPNGRQIAFWSDREGGGYFVLPIFGGSPRKVAETGLLDQATFSSFGPPQWSADGEELAFATSSPEVGSAIEIRKLETNEARLLPVPGLKDRPRQDLSWSPDGRFFAYVAALGLTADVSRLWLLRVSDGQALALTEGLYKDLSPSWSPDSRTLYFASNRGGSMDLWRQSLGRQGEPKGAPEPLTAGVGMRRARFSTTGTRLAYSKGQRVANLWRVPLLRDRQATWADAEQLTFEAAFIESVHLAPDGERFVLSSDRAGNHDLWLMDVSGGEMHQLTRSPTPDWAPQWSPDGSRIAFYSYRSGSRDIWTVPATGGQPSQLTSEEGTEANPSWSPDGRSIVFVSDHGGQTDLWIVGVEGGQPRQVTDDPTPEPFALWSADGAQIIYAHAQGGLWRVPATGGTPERLGQRYALYPQWSPDRGQILFTGVGSDSGLWSLSLADGSERRLTDFEGRHGNLGIIALATDGESLFFTWEEDLGDIWVMNVEE